MEPDRLSQDDRDGSLVAAVQTDRPAWIRRQGRQEDRRGPWALGPCRFAGRVPERCAVHPEGRVAWHRVGTELSAPPHQRSERLARRLRTYPGVWLSFQDHGLDLWQGA